MLGTNARRLLLGKINQGSSALNPPTGLSNVNRRVLMAQQEPVVSDDLAPDPTPNSDTYDSYADNDQYLAMVTNQQSNPAPADIRRVMSNTNARPQDRKIKANVTFVTGFTGTFPYVNTKPNVTYITSSARSSRTGSGALVDRGANGGVAGSDCRIIATSPDRFVSIEGIDKHQLLNIPVVTCGGYTTTRNHGPVIAIFHQFAGVMRGPSIVSSSQLEAFHNQVNDRSLVVDPNGQLITTNDGFEFPLHVRSGLPYLELRPYTDTEYETLPHVIMTSDVDWDPSILDKEFPTLGEVPTKDARNYDNGTNFDVHGNYKLGTTITLVASAFIRDHPAILDHTVLPDQLMLRSHQTGELKCRM